MSLLPSRRRAGPRARRVLAAGATLLLSLVLHGCVDAPPWDGTARALPPAATRITAREPVPAAAPGEGAWADRRFVEVDGVRLEYAERGTGGPPVVLLHGDGSMIEDFVTSGLPDMLAPRHRVVIFNRPGYGGSDRPRDRVWTPEKQAALFARAFAALGIERPVVVGHSWGALVAAALALDHPGAARGLVLASGYFFPTARPDAALFGVNALPGVGDVARYTVSPLFGAVAAPGLISLVFAPAPVPERFSAGFPVRLTLRPSQIRASAEDTALLVPAAAALRHRYAGLRVPVVIVAGASDRVLDTWQHSARLHHEVAGSSLWVVPGLGHMVHHGAPAVVLNAVESVAAAAP